jgi:inner membrane transporter RhtA
MTTPSFPLHAPLLRTLLPYLGMLTGMISLALGTSFAKTLFPLIGAQGTSAYRVGLSAVVLLAIWRPWRFRYSFTEMKGIVLFGGTIGAMNLLFYMSLKTIPLGLALAIEFSGPLTLALIHSRRWVHFLWVGFAVMGLALLLPIGSGAHNLDPVGMLLAGGAGVFWALYIIFGKRLSHIPAGQSVAMGMTMAAVVVVPFGIAEAGVSLLQPGILLAGLAVAVFSSALPYVLDMNALRQIPKRTFGVITSAEPAVGALAGLFVLHEYLSVTQWFAVGAIVVAAGGSIATAGQDEAKTVVEALPAE